MQGPILRNFLNVVISHFAPIELYALISKYTDDFYVKKLIFLLVKHGFDYIDHVRFYKREGIEKHWTYENLKCLNKYGIKIRFEHNNDKTYIKNLVGLLNYMTVEGKIFN